MLRIDSLFYCMLYSNYIDINVMWHVFSLSGNDDMIATGGAQSLKGKEELTEDQHKTSKEEAENFFLEGDNNTILYTTTTLLVWLMNTNQQPQKTTQTVHTSDLNKKITNIFIKNNKHKDQQMQTTK